MKLSILALSYLFPNPMQPSYGIFVYNRLRAIQKHCEVRVIAPVQSYPFKNATISGRNVQHQNISDHDPLIAFHPNFLVIPRLFKWFDALSYWRAVRPLVSKLTNEGFDFDLIDVHWSYPDILAAYMIAKQTNKPFIVTIRGKEALCLGEFSIRRWILNTLLKKANAVVALSSELKSILVKIGLSESRVHVILNGVNTTNFRHIDKLESRKILNIPNRDIILLSVGSLIERKGHHELIKVIPKLKKKQNISLYIVGSSGPEGDFGNKLRKMAMELAPHNIHFVEAVDHQQLCHWYNAADLFCLATKGEGCPNVVLEAMACGTPVVVSDVGAVRDIVTDGKNGFVVTHSNQLKSTIDAALALRWSREDISASMKNITWEVCAEKVLSLYNHVISRNSP